MINLVLHYCLLLAGLVWSLHGAGLHRLPQPPLGGLASLRLPLTLVSPVPLHLGFLSSSDFSFLSAGYILVSDFYRFAILKEKWQKEEQFEAPGGAF